MTTHYNIDITIAAKNGANPSDIEDEIRKQLPQDLIENVELVQKITEVEEK